MRAIELNGISIEFNKTSFNWGRYAAHDLAAVARIATPAQVIQISAIKRDAAQREAVNLDDLIARRVSLLTAYQDAAYAAHYQAFVDEVRRAESTKVGCGVRRRDDPGRTTCGKSAGWSTA